MVKHRQLARQVGVFGAIASESSMDLKINIRIPRRQLAAALIGPGRRLAVLTIFFSVVRGLEFSATAMNAGSNFESRRDESFYFVSPATTPHVSRSGDTN